jgi:hypothetical protein
VTTNVCPPIVIVALRDDAFVLAGALNVTVPLPLPVVPAVTVSHVALLVAVHPQPLPAVTLTEPAPPVATTDALGADNV